MRIDWSLFFRFPFYFAPFPEIVLNSGLKIGSINIFYPYLDEFFKADIERIFFPVYHS